MDGDGRFRGPFPGLVRQIAVGLVTRGPTRYSPCDLRAPARDARRTADMAGARRIVRYRRGDGSERAELADDARSVGVPELLLDWVE